MLDITQLNAFLASQAAGGDQSSAPQPGVLDSPMATVGCTPKPKVTWRVTRSCNQKCSSCISDSKTRRYGAELTTAEGMALIRDLAAFETPSLLFAGGEPLMRADLPDLVGYARRLGIHPRLFTNGTLLSPNLAAKLKRAGLHSIAILLEGLGRNVDRQRGMRGAFASVMEGYANAEAAGLAVEIRTPLNRANYSDLAAMLDFIEFRGFRQVVFAHLVYAGRGNNPQDDLTHEEKRCALDMILERAEDFQRRQVGIRLATDDNDVDLIYYYLRLARTHPLRAAAALRVLPAYGASVQGAGLGLAGIDAVGNVSPDAYWANYVLGNVRDTPFSAIWTQSTDPLLQGLRNRLPLLKGRCANCLWKQACGGSLRVRAQAFFGDPWMADPACYLTSQEISKEVIEQVEAMECDVLLEEQAA